MADATASDSSTSISQNEEHTIAESQAPCASLIQVINTPELLEAILLYLPGVDIARMRRVQTQIRDTIMGSKRLRAVLHLDGERAPTDILLFDQDDKATLSQYHLVQTPTRDGAIICTVHPAPLFTTSRTPRCPALPLPPSMIQIQIDDGFKMLRWQPGPWRTQFLTQPPTKHLAFHFRPSVPHKGGQRWYSDYMSAPGGITLGILCDVVKKCGEHWAVGYWRDQWEYEGRPESELRLMMDLDVPYFAEEGREIVMMAKAAQEKA